MTKMKMEMKDEDDGNDEGLILSKDLKKFLDSQNPDTYKNV